MDGNYMFHSKAFERFPMPPPGMEFPEEIDELEFDANQEEEEMAESKETWFALDLSNMGIKALSKEIKYYTHLTGLNVSNNKITTLPDEIFVELKSLIQLDLSYNMLSKVPASVLNLTNLEHLNLQQNRIVELPVELGHLYKLKQLQLDGNPLTNPPKAIVQAGAPAIVSYLRERAPAGPPPPERRFISYIDAGTSVPEKDRIRVLTYNVLAESYAAPDRYFYCPMWALDWEHRKRGILKDLLSYDCDIICLQEVEAVQFQSFFQPELGKAGYAGIIALKSRARTMDNWGNIDGCAIFYKQSKYNLIEDHVIEFQSIAIGRHKEFVEDNESFSRLITKDNVAIAAVLQIKEDVPNSPSRHGKTWVPKKHVLIANAHIHWNPEHKDVKLIQVQMLMEELSAMVGPKSKWNKVPMIIAGDFNSTPDSGPYELLKSGRLGPNHPDLYPYTYGGYTTQGLRHNIRVSSAYAPLGEPVFTNYTFEYVGVLDYIWYSHDSLGVSKVLQPVEEEVVRNTKLPNAHMHSDHIFLLAEFFLNA